MSLGRGSVSQPTSERETHQFSDYINVSSSASAQYLYSRNSEGNTDFFDPVDFQPIVPPISPQLNTAAMDPTGQFFGHEVEPGQFEIWSIKENKKVARLSHGESNLTYAYFSAAGKYVITKKRGTIHSLGQFFLDEKVHL